MGMTQRINFKVEMIRDIIVFSVSGSLDLYTLPKFKAAIDILISRNMRFFIIDLSEMVSIDTEGMRVFREYASKLRLVNGLLVLSNLVNYDIISMFKSAQMESEVEVYDSNTAALDSFVARRDEELIADLRNLFHVGQTVEINFDVLKKSFAKYVKVLSTDKTRIVIDWPKDDKGSIIFLTKGLLIKGRILGMNSIYTFETNIEDLNRTHPCIILKKPLNFEKDFKRIHTRADSDLISTFQRFNADGSLKPGVLSGKITNISGGGCQMITSQNIEKETYLHIAVRFGTEISNSINAKVVRSVKKIINDREVYELGLHFTALFEKERKEILKFVLNNTSG
jgi:anti-anti-sigma factor